VTTTLDDLNAQYARSQRARGFIEHLRCLAQPNPATALELLERRLGARHEYIALLKTSVPAISIAGSGADLAQLRLSDAFMELVRRREVLGRNITEARQVLGQVLDGPFKLTPILEPDRRGYRFEGAVHLGNAISGAISRGSSTGVPGRI
jgi:hypothetical protein